MIQTRFLPRPGPKARHQGFTLVEVLVALAILSVGLLALLSIQANAMRFNSAGREIRLAQDVLTGTVDEIKTLSNFQLRDPANVFPDDGADDAGSLPGEFQFDGMDTSLPEGYDYVRWRPVTVTDTNGTAHRYTVKLAVDQAYLLQDVLARGEATVFWPSSGQLSGRPVDRLQVTFFTERKP